MSSICYACTHWWHTNSNTHTNTQINWNNWHMCRAQRSFWSKAKAITMENSRKFHIFNYEGQWFFEGCNRMCTHLFLLLRRACTIYFKRLSKWVSEREKELIRLVSFDCMRSMLLIKHMLALFNYFVLLYTLISCKTFYIFSVIICHACGWLTLRQNYRCASNSHFHFFSLILINNTT